MSTRTIYTMQAVYFFDSREPPRRLRRVSVEDKGHVQDEILLEFADGRSFVLAKVPELYSIDLLREISAWIGGHDADQAFEKINISTILDEVREKWAQVGDIGQT